MERGVDKGLETEMGVGGQEPLERGAEEGESRRKGSGREEQTESTSQTSKLWFSCKQRMKM